jgi:hypothetical protein
VRAPAAVSDAVRDRPIECGPIGAGLAAGDDPLECVAHGGIIMRA